jgi:iron(III) transport system ATP-binding protein
MNLSLAGVEPQLDPPTAASPSHPVVSLRSVAKSFRRAGGELVHAIAGVSLDIVPGEFLVLLGPSGCGKTTLLRSIAGLERPDAGRIEIHGQAVFDDERGIDVAPERRALSMIFQSYALWPHMTVFKNVSYPLENARRRPPRAEIRERAEHVLRLLGLAALAKQHPGQLSGGQQQRVALARALVGGDDLILFDEPLSNVDAKVREQLRLELLSMQAELGFSAVYVTHDQAEAMELADRIVVVQDGKVAQVGTPRQVYEEPDSRYVATFVGVSNEIGGRLASRRPNGLAVVDTPVGPISGQGPDDAVAEGEEVVAVFRPERCRLSRTEPDTVNRWRVAVDASLFLGPHVEQVVQLGEHHVRIWKADAATLERGATGWLSVEPQMVRILPASGAIARSDAADHE